MADLAQWSLIEPSGRKHDVRVRRALLGTRVVLDRRAVPRFDRAAQGDRYAMTLAGHMVNVTVPPATSGQPTLTVDGSEAFGGEVALAPAAPATSAGASPITGQDFARYQLLQRRNTGGAWFYWIAGASLLNSLLYAARIDWGLFIGLGITQVIDGLAIALSGTVRTPVYAIVADVLVAGAFFLFGRAARAGRLAIFAIGIVVYALDGLIFIWAEDWLALAFHGFVVFGLMNGWRAARALGKLDSVRAAA